MLPGLTVPPSLAVLLQACRSCFSARSFPLFTLLAVGMIAQSGPCTVTGILLGSGLSTVITHDRAHRFFNAAHWSADQLGLAVARMIVEQLTAPGAALTLAIDDTLFKRRGKKVHGAFWSHDASQLGHVTARGNRWVIAALVVDLPFLPRPVALPVLLRLWAGKGTPSHVELARTLIGLLARAFPEHTIHVACDAAYHGKAFRDLPERVTVTTRLPRNAVLYAYAPAPTGKRGRPALKGERLGTQAQAAAQAPWRTATVRRYGRDDQIEITERECLWYGAFHARRGRLIAARETRGGKLVHLMLFTTDLDSGAEEIIARYAARWSIEVAIETAKGPMGVGQARNRVNAAVERTVPFGMLVMSIVYLWYAQYGHH
ncbi:MAG: IS701 family transposase, partial [Streptosporangiaceae bacterium]